MKNIIFGSLLALSLVGCAGKYNIKSSDNMNTYTAKTAHVVHQGGNSKDMDAHVSRAFVSKGFKVSESLPNQTIPKTDLVVKYTDSWRWDITMYLNAVDITVVDRNGNILATGNYTNSPFWHEWPSEGQVVQKIVDDMFVQMGRGTSQKQAAVKP
jgi:hypothetical protein